MGNCYNQCLEFFDSGSKIIVYERIRQPSFLEHYNTELFLKKRNSRILKEDKEHFFQNENWFEEICRINNNKPFLDATKFMENYPHYKIEQVSFSYYYFLL